MMKYIQFKWKLILNDKHLLKDRNKQFKVIKILRKINFYITIKVELFIIKLIIIKILSYLE